MPKVWTTQGGKKVKVKDMTDHHVWHVYRAIVDGRLFSPVAVGPIGLLPEDDARAVNRRRARAKGSWLRTFREEISRRGLDPDTAPTRRVSLLDWVLGELDDMLAVTVEEARRRAEGLLALAGVSPPEIDVSNQDERPTYCHWLTGSFGRPIDGR